MAGGAYVALSPLPTSLGIREAKGAAWAEAGTTCDPKGRESRWGVGDGMSRTWGPDGGGAWVGDSEPQLRPSAAAGSRLLVRP